MDILDEVAYKPGSCEELHIENSVCTDSVGEESPHLIAYAVIRHYSKHYDINEEGGVRFEDHF